MINHAPVFGLTVTLVPGKNVGQIVTGNRHIVDTENRVDLQFFDVL